MSRFSNDDWDGDGLPWQMWHKTVENALKGKRGQSVLRELKEALLALSQPRLIDDYLIHEGEVCALGALAANRLKVGPISFQKMQITSLQDLEERFGEQLTDEFETVEFGKRMGLTGALTWAIGHQNDEGSWNDETPEIRYQRMLHWIDQQLIS